MELSLSPVLLALAPASYGLTGAVRSGLRTGQAATERDQATAKRLAHFALSKSSRPARRGAVRPSQIGDACFDEDVDVIWDLVHVLSSLLSPPYPAEFAL